MKNQTIVSLGGAYVERVSNPPDVHNLQTSRSVWGGVSNGCESNERNVGTATGATRAQCGLFSFSLRKYGRTRMCYELYATNGLIRIHEQQFKNILALVSAGKNTRHDDIMGNRWSNISKYLRWLRYSSNCVRLNSESGVVA